MRFLRGAAGVDQRLATLMPGQRFSDAGQSLDQYFHIVGEQNYPGFSRVHRGRWGKSSGGKSHFYDSLAAPNVSSGSE